MVAAAGLAFSLPQPTNFIEWLPSWIWCFAMGIATMVAEIFPRFIANILYISSASLVLFNGCKDKGLDFSAENISTWCIAAALALLGFSLKNFLYVVSISYPSLISHIIQDQSLPDTFTIWAQPPAYQR